MAPARSLQKMNSKMAELNKDIAEFTEDKAATVKRNEVFRGSGPSSPFPADKPL